MTGNSLRLLQERIDSVIKGKQQAVKMAIVTLLGRGMNDEEKKRYRSML